MVESVRLRLLTIALAAAMLSVGCGESALQSPTGPSGALGSAAGDVELLAKNGHGRGGGAPDGDEFDNGNGKPPDHSDGPGRSHQAHVVGFVTANDGAALTVEGITIVPGMDAVIRHGHRVLTIDDIEVGDHIVARGVMEDTTLVAEEIKVQDTGNDNDDDGTEGGALRGTISGLAPVGSGCPTVTFTIGTTIVTTSASTTFDDVTCAMLANGALVEVEGTTQADGSILATNVDAAPDEVSGTISDFSGAASCPTATFKVGPLAKTVNLTATTTFTGVTCATLANGASVEVEGTNQADGSITAASVEAN